MPSRLANEEECHYITILWLSSYVIIRHWARAVRAIVVDEFAIETSYITGWRRRMLPKGLGCEVARRHRSALMYSNG